MSELSSIFSDIENTKDQIAQKRLERRMLTGKISAVILSIILLLSVLSAVAADHYTTFVIMIVLVLFSILSFKWPFIFLLILSIIYSVLLIISTISYFAESTLGNIYIILGALLASLLFLILLIFMIRGTIAASKYRKLKFK